MARRRMMKARRRSRHRTSVRPARGPSRRPLPFRPLTFGKMAITTRSVTDVCVAARAAARQLAALDSATRDVALHAIADALESRTDEIVEANARDMEAGREAQLSEALLDRLMLDERRVVAIAAQVRDIAALPDPVGELIDGFRLPNGLDVRKVRVPLGVVA